jgi:hypothetical protein
VRSDGPEHEALNRQPLFRYNAYTGIYAVHYLDLVSVQGPDPLPLAGLLAGTALVHATRLVAHAGTTDPPLRPWAQGLFNHPATLHFLATVTDGRPRLAPLLPAVVVGGSTVRFAAGLDPALGRLAPGEPVALFAMNLQMESVLVRGRFAGQRGLGPATVGEVEIDWVYNSMPPKQGQIYPRVPLQPVTTF